MMGRAISDIPDFKDTVEDFSPDRCALSNISRTFRLCESNFTFASCQTGLKMAALQMVGQ